MSRAARDAHPSRLEAVMDGEFQQFAIEVDGIDPRALARRAEVDVGQQPRQHFAPRGAAALPFRLRIAASSTLRPSPDGRQST